MIKGVIFDIDGVIVDSEPLHMEALIHVIEEMTGSKVDFKAEDLIGLSLEATLKEVGIPKENIPEVTKQIGIYYKAHLNSSYIRKDMKKLWEALIKENILFGCVSTAELAVCKMNIGVLGLEKDVPIVGFESVSKPKPHPMPYLKMLEILGLSADEVIVLEDSDLGIHAARAAGIENVYGWPHNLSFTQKYEEAKKVIQSLEEVDFFKKLLID